MYNGKHGGNPEVILRTITQQVIKTQETQKAVSKAPRTMTTTLKHKF